MEVSTADEPEVGGGGRGSRAPVSAQQAAPGAPAGEEFDIEVDPAIEAALLRLRVGQLPAPVNVGVANPAPVPRPVAVAAVPSGPSPPSEAGTATDGSDSEDGGARGRSGA
eukprot:15458899-Alexandrium_andersonii.AAC.1